MTNAVQLATAILFQVCDTNWTDAQFIGYSTNTLIPYPMEKQTGIRVTNCFASFSASSSRYLVWFETLQENPSTNPPVRIIRQEPNTFPRPGWKSPAPPQVPPLPPGVNVP